MNFKLIGLTALIASGTLFMSCCTNSELTPEPRPPIKQEYNALGRQTYITPPRIIGQGGPTITIPAPSLKSVLP